MPDPTPQVKAERIRASNASNIRSGHRDRLRLLRAQALAVENPLTHCCPACGVSLYDPDEGKFIRRCWECSWEG